MRKKALLALAVGTAVLAGRLVLSQPADGGIGIDSDHQDIAFRRARSSPATATRTG